MRGKKFGMTQAANHEEELMEAEQIEAQKLSEEVEEKYANAVNQGNTHFHELAGRVQKMYANLDNYHLERGKLLHALADNIIVHQTNQ